MLSVLKDNQRVEGLDDLTGLQLPLKEGSRQVEPSERVMHSMTTRSFRSAGVEICADTADTADTMDIGAERV